MKNSYVKYIRHIILPEIGLNGQDNISSSKILCVGSGGLGSPLLIYLSSSGVKNIGLVEFDCVSYSNLNRQIIYSDLDVGKDKSFLVKKYFKKFNKDINIYNYEVKLTANNCSSIFSGYDLIIDCTDNLESKFLINDFAIKLSIPFIHGSVFGLEGYIASFFTGKSCYRCLYESYNDISIFSYGILGSTAGIIGSMQSLISTLYLSNKNKKDILSLFDSKLLIFNFKSLNIKFYDIKKSANCVYCYS